MKHHITINNTPLCYTSTGSGIPVVCIHGNPGSSMDFQTEPVKGHRIIAIDRPGHGDSLRYQTNGNHLQTQTDIIKGFIESMNLGSVILAGHSWGSLIALSFALSNPDSLRALILMAPIAYPREPVSEPVSGIVKAMKLPVAGKLITSLLASTAGKRAITDALEKGFHPEPMPDNYRNERLPEFFSPEAFRTICEDKADFEFRATHLSTRYKSIRTKTYLVCGENDIVAETSTQAAALLTDMPNAEIRLLKQTGHQIPQQNRTILRDVLESINTEKESA